MSPTTPPTQITETCHEQDMHIQDSLSDLVEITSTDVGSTREKRGKVFVWLGRTREELDALATVL